jgi:hypothetical protein
MPMAEWYYTKNGQQSGPIDAAELRQLILSGQLAASELVWKDGMPGWVPASTISELGGNAAAGTPVAAPYPQQQAAQPLQYGGYAAPQPQYGAGSVPNYLVQSILVTIFCCWPL